VSARTVAALREWAAPIAAWLVSRVLVIAVAIVGANWLGPPGDAATASVVPHPLSLLGSWDTGWYLSIARSGYQFDTSGIAHNYSTFAFFPGLPAVMHLGIITGTNPFLWGFVASNLALLVALCAVHALSRDRRGSAFADRAVWILALSPPAVYASLAYTDGILLAFAACAALAAVRGRWLVAGLAAAAAVLIRPQGILVAVLVVLLALAVPAATGMRARRALLGGIPALIALAAFLAWMQAARGAWDLPLRAQAAWNRTSPGIAALRGLGTELAALGRYPFTARHPELTHACGPCTGAGATGPVRDVVAGALMIVLVVGLIRFEGSWYSPWVVYAALAVLAPLDTGTFDSLTRFGLLAFPLVWPVAVWARRPRRVVVLCAAEALLVVPLVLQIHAVAP
jgi:hypothetical protein